MTMNKITYWAQILFAIVVSFAAMNSAHAWDCAGNPAYWYLNVSGNECYHSGPAPSLPGYPATAGSTSNASAAANQSQSQSTKVSNANAVKTNVSVSQGANTNTNQNRSNASTGPVNANATGGAGGSASNNASSGNTISSEYDAARIPVNTALAGVGKTTAGCRFAEGLGVQTLPAGTSIGLSFKDHDCVRFQLAQFFYSRGQDIAGDKVTCQITEVRKALGSDCEQTLAITHTAAPVDAVTHAELQAVEKRIVTRTLNK